MDRMFRTPTLVAALMVATATPTVFAATAQTVTITLQDSSGDPSHQGMVMKSDTGSVRAGRVTFRATNLSKELLHEMLVLPAPRGGKELPYDPRTNTVMEKRAHSMGEISDLRPGAHGALTLTLKPGTYLLICNQPGHYKAGMSTTLTVEK